MIQMGHNSGNWNTPMNIPCSECYVSLSTPFPGVATSLWLPVRLIFDNRNSFTFEGMKYAKYDPRAPTRKLMHPWTKNKAWATNPMVYQHVPIFSPSFDGQKFRKKHPPFSDYTHIIRRKDPNEKPSTQIPEARVSRQQVQLTSGIWVLRHAAALVLPNAQPVWGSISSPDGDFSCTIYPLVI